MERNRDSRFSIVEARALERVTRDERRNRRLAAENIVVPSRIDDGATQEDLTRFRAETGVYSFNPDDSKITLWTSRAETKRRKSVEKRRGSKYGG